MILAIIMLALVLFASLLAIAILLRALDAARDNERDAMRLAGEAWDLMDELRASVSSTAKEQHGIRSDASKKGWQTRKRRAVVGRVLQQDHDIATMIGGGQ